MSVPIIFYHEIFKSSVNSNKYAISKAVFEEQMEYLSENGFDCITLDNFFADASAAESGKKRVVISFDDGHYSDYSIAFRILDKLGLKATFFVTAGWVGAENYVNGENLAEMSASEMSIQSHGLTHSFLSELAAESLRTELYESKKLLEANIGGTVNFISAPGGFCSKDVLKMAKDLGYKGVCDSTPGTDVRFSPDRKFAFFNRFLITRNTTFDEFKSIVNGNSVVAARRKAIYCFKNNVRRLLGSRAYYAIWSMFFKKA